MLRSLNRFLAFVALVMSSQAMALGLGEIRLDSALNEPLRAEIVLLSATAEELENLTVRMASADTFARYGLDRPAYLQTVQFRIIPSGRTDGNIVRLISAEPITEPFLTFLVEASWSRGRLLREYTVLLDPPTFAPPPSGPVTQSVQPPVRSQPADSGEIARPAPRPQPEPQPAQPASRPSLPQSTAAEPAPVLQDPEPEPVQQEPEPVQQDPAPAPEPAGFDTTSAGDYRVQAGDTLWSIANRYRPDNRLTINQTMVAIYEANPEAFEGNINRLSAGANLRIPSADDVFRITRADALAEVQRQHSAWQPGSAGVSAPVADAGPSLELVPPDEDTLADDSTGTYEGPDLPDDAAAPSGSLDDIRIAEIEDLLADEQDGLVVIEDNELAALRRELATLRGEPLPADLPAEPAADAVVDEPAAADDNEIFVDDTEPAAADDSAVDAAPEPAPAEPAAPPRPAARPAARESLVDTVIGYLTGIWGLVGIAVVLVLAVLVFFARRAVRSGDDEGTGMWEAFDEDTGARTQRVPTIRGDETIVVEETPGGGTVNERSAMTGTMEIPGAMRSFGDGEDTAEATALHSAQSDNYGEVAMDDTFSSDTALNLDQSDPIAEADFHMAYGLYDQAADLINGALAVEPGRTDLLAKLCEIYFVWGNRDAFIDAAERFKNLLGDAEDPEWDKTVIMGQQIAGDHDMFSDAPAGATRAVDLAFGDDDDGAALDMDFAGGDDDIFDLGSEESVDRLGAQTNTALDFVFDDEDSGGTAETAAMPAGGDDPFAAAFDDDDDVKTREMRSPSDETAEMPTAEMPSMDDATAEMPTVESSLDGQTAENREIEDPFADLAETGELPSVSDDEVTKVASLDDDDTPSDATAEIDLDDLGLDLDALSSDLDATAEGEALDIDPDATGRNEALSDSDPTGRNEAFEEGMDDDATSLLDATGQTQVLSDDFAVETGTRIDKGLSDDDDPLAEDAETLLASLDDDDTADGNIEFAETEALPDGIMDDDATSSGGTDLDLDLDDLTAALELSAGGETTVNQAANDRTVEQPRPSANGDDSPTAAIAPEDLSDDLHDARTMTEVGTKLDLARAYVDMGDPSGARSILEEVLDEGDESQRQQAQQLLDSLPA